MADKPKRTLIFSTAYFPFVGGAEVAIKEITDRLKEYQFELITARMDPDLPEEEQMGNVLVHRIGKGTKLDKILLPLRGTRFVLKMLKDNPPDMYWAVMATFASGIPYIVNILKPKQHIPVVMTLQEGDSEKYIASKWGGLVQMAWRLALPRSDLVTVLSHYLKGRAYHYGYRGEIEIIPNGVDVHFYGKKPDQDEVGKLIKRFKKKDKEKYIITVSRLNRKNAIDDIIKALLYLPKNIKLLIVGVGEDGEKLWELAKDKGVEDRVRFLGWDGHDKLPALFAVSDVFVRPSLSEGQGISFLEAMAARIPVIATPVGGIPDFLRDDSSPLGKVVPTGLFCNVRDPEDLAQQINKVIKDDELRERIILGARTLVEKEYDWKYIVEDMRKKVFKKILDKPPQ